MSEAAANKKTGDKFVCLGWGSLVWNPDTLPILSEWHKDGPHLPLEFARESNGKRITLVIVERDHAVPVLWAKLKVSSLDEAIAALALREGVPKLNVIGRWPNETGNHYLYEDTIARWASGKGFSGAVWTALLPGMKKMKSEIPSLQQIKDYLSMLPESEIEKAAEYIFKAPEQITTPYRQSLADTCKFHREKFRDK